MKQYKYSVVTTNFGNYENIKEIENPVPDVEYVLVTDNPTAKYKTWKTVLFHDYDKLVYPELAWIYVKWFTFNYCTSDVCLYIDGSIKIQSDFSELIQYFLDNKYEYAATIEHVYCTSGSMLEVWGKENFHGYTTEAASSTIQYLKDIGCNVDAFGLLNTSFLLKRKTEFTKLIDETTWNILTRNNTANKTEQRVMEPAFTYSLYKNAYHNDKILVLEHNIKWSKWFTWRYHNSNMSTVIRYSFANELYIYTGFKWIFQNNIIHPISYEDITNKIDSNPLLTVVITAYNKENTIKRSITSVRQMSYNNWECIIVDNDSSDNTKDVILDTIEGDDRFIYVRQKNKHLCNSRNVGSFLGSGKYLLHVDGDDTIGKYFCEYAVKELEKNEDCCISTGIFNRIYQNNECQYFVTSAAEYGNYSPETRVNFICKVNPFPVESVMRMSTFKSIGGFREGLENFAEDAEMFIRYIHASLPNNNVHFIYDTITTTMYEQVSSKSSYTELDKSKTFTEFYKHNKELFETYLTKEEIHEIINK